MDRSRWIVVGTDFSPAADRALERGAELAAAIGASVALVHAYEDSPGTPFRSDRSPELREQLEHAAAPLRSRYPDLRVEAIVRRGAPWDKLVNVAFELGAEMIVVGASSPTGPAHEAMLGRVVSRVAGASSRSVLVVPAHGA